MIISDDMMRYYIGDITSGYFSHHDVPADNVTEYAPFIENMRKLANLHGDLDYLRLGLEYLLAHPEIELLPFAHGDSYPYWEEQIREIIEYAWKMLWPNALPISPGGPSGVELVPMSLEEWWRHTGHRP